MNKEDYSGHWKGEIIYGKEYAEDEGNKLFFDLEIQQYDTKISGVAVDTAGVGTSPDKAIINGTILNKKITFLKQYTHAHYRCADGSTYIDKNKQGHLIYYSGSYDAATGKFSGVWSIKQKRKLFGFIPVSYNAANGAWEMSRA